MGIVLLCSIGLLGVAIVAGTIILAFTGDPSEET